MNFRWDNRSGQAESQQVLNVITAGRWHHIGMQKNLNDSNVRIYRDGILILTVDVPYSLTNFDMIKFGRVDGFPRIREFSVRTAAPLPTVPYTVGDVSFAAAIGDTQKRFNSYMLG